jgi:transposase-like protein
MQVSDETFRSPGLSGVAGDADAQSCLRHVFERQLGECPACGSPELEPVVENRTPELHWFCRDCGRCWQVELGSVHRITPPVCFGCEQRARCEGVYTADQERTLGL